MESSSGSGKKSKTQIADFRRQPENSSKHLDSDKKELESKLKKALNKYNQSIESTVRTLEEIVKLIDLYTANHQKRVAELSLAVAQKMNLPDKKVHRIFLSASLHDIGKIAIPQEFFNKGDKLNEHEQILIQSHPEIGCSILKILGFPWPIENIALKHHERLDGSGYPFGIKGDDIELETRIVSVADVVEAMISYRPFRPPLGVEAAMEEIRKNKGVLYDSRVVDVCLNLFIDGFEFEEDMIKVK